MPDNDSPAADPAVATEPLATDAGAASTQSTQTDEPAQPSKREWVEYRKEQRETSKKLDVLIGLAAQGKTALAPAPKEDSKAQVATAQPDAALAEVARLRAEINFERALNGLGLPLNDKQRAVALQSYSASGAENASEWAAEFADAMGWKKPPAPTAPAAASAPKPATPAAAPGAKSDTGAPGSSPAAGVNSATSIKELDITALKSMTPEARKAVWARVNHGTSANPYKRSGGRSSS